MGEVEETERVEYGEEESQEGSSYRIEQDSTAKGWLILVP
jgi:hypothetical protein